MSGIKKRRDSGVQWYRGTITLQAYGYDNVRILNGFLAGLRGTLHAFSLPLGGAYANPNIGSNPNLSKAHAIGSETVALFHTGHAISGGSVFTVPNDTKLYTLLENVGGSGSYEIIPALRRAVPMTAPLNFLNPSITALLDGNETTIEHSGNGIMAQASLSWSEAL